MRKCGSATLLQCLNTGIGLYLRFLAFMYFYENFSWQPKKKVRQRFSPILFVVVRSGMEKSQDPGSGINIPDSRNTGKGRIFINYRWNKELFWKQPKRMVQVPLGLNKSYYSISWDSRFDVQARMARRRRRWASTMSSSQSILTSRWTSPSTSCVQKRCGSSRTVFAGFYIISSRVADPH